MIKQVMGWDANGSPIAEDTVECYSCGKLVSADQTDMVPIAGTYPISEEDYDHFDFDAPVCFLCLSSDIEDEEIL